MRPDELNALAKRTRLIINCVGPYHLYSTPVVEACATNGTHYVDVYVSLLCGSRQLPLTFFRDRTGETPWVRKILHQYHTTAEKNGAIVSACPVGIVGTR